MIKVRQSFEELRIGDEIVVKGYDYCPRIMQKLPGKCLVVAGNGPSGPISYDQYDYTLVEDWPFGAGIRFVAIRLPLTKLSVDMQIASKGNHGSMPLVYVQGDKICLHNVLRDTDFYISYDHDYNYSLVRPCEAAELVDDELQKLAFRILAQDPMALDAAKDILKC